MKLPKDIVGINKVRDLDICRLYIQGHTAEEIKSIRNLPLTVRRVNQVIYDNAAFLNPRVAWPKTERIHKRQRIAKRLEGKDSERMDETSALDALMKEIEGDKSLVDQSHHEHITIVVDQQAAKELGFEVRPELPSN